MKETEVTGPDGKVTRIVERKRGGCGCGTFLTVMVVLFVIGAPATYFPLWLAIIAYIFEGILALGLIVSRITEKHWAWET